MHQTDNKPSCKDLILDFDLIPDVLLMNLYCLAEQPGGGAVSVSAQLYILKCLMTPLGGATWTELYLKSCYSHTFPKTTQHPIFFTFIAHAAK